VTLLEAIILGAILGLVLGVVIGALRSRRER
jgi:hypothetical protein